LLKDKKFNKDKNCDLLKAQINIVKDAKSMEQSPKNFTFNYPDKHTSLRRKSVIKATEYKFMKSAKNRGDIIQLKFPAKSIKKSGREKKEFKVNRFEKKSTDNQRRRETSNTMIDQIKPVFKKGVAEVRENKINE
jgi:hypothetical protein